MSDDARNKIECELGTLTLEVEGEDAQWVRETFREEWASRMREAEDMATALQDGARGHQ